MRRRTRKWYDSAVASRPWTRDERRVVLRGFYGRLTIAIEPLIASAFFALLPVGLALRKQEAVLLLAPIFAMASLCFLTYAIWLLVPSARALAETFGRIYVVDGYVRYRIGRSGLPEYYVAVLAPDRQPLEEWPLHEWPHAIGKREMWPVLVEFSPYGGIHKIDGRSTGVLPEKISPFGIGIAHDDARRASRP